MFFIFGLSKNPCCKYYILKRFLNHNDYSMILVSRIVMEEKIKKRRSVIDVTVKRGDIYYADLSPVVGSEQGGVRPVLIVQNDIGNKYSPTVIAAAITSQREKSKLPTHIELTSERCGLSKDSVVLLEQIRTIDKRRLKEKMGTIDDIAIVKVNKALSISFGLGGEQENSFF